LVIVSFQYLLNYISLFWYHSCLTESQEFNVFTVIVKTQ